MNDCKFPILEDERRVNVSSLMWWRLLFDEPINYTAHTTPIPCAQGAESHGIPTTQRDCQCDLMGELHRLQELIKV